MSDNTITAYSVADADRQLTLWGLRSDPDDIELPKKIIDAVCNNEKTVRGNATEYHNLASEFARQRMYRYATAVATTGAKKYKNDVDLLADILKFGSQSQEWEGCDIAYRRLQSIGYSKWSWRTFTFTFDYLIDLEDQPSDFGERNIKDEILPLIKAYKKLNDERAWVAEAEYHIKNGDNAAAEKTLLSCVQKVHVTPQCCLKLADIFLKKGKYNDVIKYSAIGVRSAAQEQPSISTGYLYYVSALAKDALIHDEAIQYPNEDGKGFMNRAAVEDALCHYSIAADLLSDRRNYLKTIEQRTIILRKKSALNSDI